MLLAHAEQGPWRGRSSRASSWWGGVRWAERGGGNFAPLPPPPSSSPQSRRSAAAQLNFLGSLALRDATGATPAELAAGRSHKLLAARLEREASERAEAAARASAPGFRGALRRLAHDAALAPFTAALVAVLLAVFELRVVRSGGGGGGQAGSSVAAAATNSSTSSASALPFPPPPSHATRVAANLTFFLALAGLVLFAGKPFCCCCCCLEGSGDAGSERNGDGRRVKKGRALFFLLPLSLSLISFTHLTQQKQNKTPSVTVWTDPGVVPRDGEESGGARASGDGCGGRGVSAAAGNGNGNGKAARKIRSTDAGELDGDDDGGDALERGARGGAVAASNGVSSGRASPLSSSSPTAAAAAAAAASMTTTVLPPPAASIPPSSQPSLADSLAALFAEEEEERRHNAFPNNSSPSPSALGRLCVACCSVRPLRAKHCSRLGRCVALYDHYCPWLGCTVGGGNRHLFLWFLTLETGAVVLAAVAAVGRLRAVGAAAAAEGAAAAAAASGATAAAATSSSISDPTSPLSGFPNDSPTTAAAVEAALWIAAFLVADLFVLVSLAALLGTQLWQAAQALTTNEAANWRRYPYLRDGRSGKFSNPFDEGCARNLAAAMMPPPPSSKGGDGLGERRRRQVLKQQQRQRKPRWGISGGGGAAQQQQQIQLQVRRRQQHPPNQKPHGDDEEEGGEDHHGSHQQQQQRQQHRRRVQQQQQQQQTERELLLGAGARGGSAV